MPAEDIRHPEKQPNSSKGGRKKYKRQKKETKDVAGLAVTLEYSDQKGDKKVFVSGEDWECNGKKPDLIEKVNNFKISQNNTPPQITNNVSIQEAHAWDYSHIKDLAEKVADVITPKILNALGGNSNGY